MNNVKLQISLEDARKIAEEAVLNDKANYLYATPDSALEEDYLEAEYCWIFFRNKKIVVLPECWFTDSYGAFAISKKGTFSQITMLERDQVQQLAYLKTMSDYFCKRGE